MTFLHFNCDFLSKEVSDIELPIEVRKPNYALIARTVKNQPIVLAPGSYHVIAHMPGGMSVQETIEITGLERDVTVTLKPDDEGVTPDSTLEEALLVLGRTSAVSNSRPLIVTRSPVSDFRGGENPREPVPEFLGKKKFELRGFSGNIAHANQPLGWPWYSALPGNTTTVSRFRIEPGEPRVLELVQPTRPTRRMMLPVSAKEGCEIVISDRAVGGVSLDIRLQHVGADALMRYLQRGLFNSASSAGNAIDAEQLLARKIENPIAATVGVYALLRLGELERLHDWTGNLNDWYTSIPDGAAVRAEHLARLGKHEDALVTLLQLRQRGVPIFADGLSYATNRLRQFVSAASGPTRRELEETLKLLDRFASIADYRRPYSTFDPNDIDDENIVDASKRGTPVLPDWSTR